MHFDSLRFGIRYLYAGIATRSYVTLYNIIRRLSMRLLSCGCQMKTMHVCFDVETTS